MRIYCFGINLIFTFVIIFEGMVLSDRPAAAAFEHDLRLAGIPVDHVTQESGQFNYGIQQCVQGTPKGGRGCSDTEHFQIVNVINVNDWHNSTDVTLSGSKGWFGHHSCHASFVTDLVL